MKSNTDHKKKRTTLYLPEWLHRAIKLESVQTDQDMTTILVEQMAARYANKDSLFFVPESQTLVVEKEKVSLS